MQENNKQNPQYDSCYSKGICTINPKIISLQRILIMYLALISNYLLTLKNNDINDNEIEDFTLNAISISILNLQFTENIFEDLVKKFNENIQTILNKYSHILNTEKEMEYLKSLTFIKKSKSIIDAIQYGEQDLLRIQQEIPFNIRDLYIIILFLVKKISINLLTIKFFQKETNNTFTEILKVLSGFNTKQNLDNLKEECINLAQIDIKINSYLKDIYNNRYGEATKYNVSYSTTPGKAILVVGKNLYELEQILKATEKENIDIYTHDDMILAHTYPFFQKFTNLKGQYGLGLENCLLDFSTFPGPIILTKHSLNNVENFYRGKLFTTDYTSPKGIIKINNNDFSEVIKSAKKSKGFKTGKKCDTVSIGINYSELKNTLTKRLKEKEYKKIIIISQKDNNTQNEQKIDNFILNTSKDTLLITLNKNYNLQNTLYFDKCYLHYLTIQIINEINDYEIEKEIIFTNIDKNSLSQIIYLSTIKNINLYVGTSNSRIFNPTLQDTLIKNFNIKPLNI